MTTPKNFERHYADVNGTRLSYLRGGSGPPLLLLHGWPQTALAWRDVLEPLAAGGYTVIAPDLRGLGQSEHAEDGYDKDNQSEDMRQLIRALGFGPHVRVVGHDIGGMVAFSFARLHPDELDRLVLIDLAVPGFGLEQAMDVAHGGRWHFGLFMAPKVPELLFDGHEHAFFQLWFPSLAADSTPFTADVIEEVTRYYSGEEALRCGFEHYRTLLADGRTNRSWGDAGNKLTMPVLAIGGEHAAGARLGESLSAIADSVRTEVVRGSGHFVPEERPTDLVRTLTEFLG
ncbi:alpha/beta hydrolase [Streptomyces sp. NPDC046985]|uniref:alpha/beta fold hydrolase n=1 Tax=Streptomyces sp. NPDC046985 TaxID=3155377 RepID=UPI0033ED728C